MMELGEHASRPGRRGLIVILVCVAGGIAAVSGMILAFRPGPPAPTGADAEVAQQLNVVCASCHAFPPPDSFPRPVWNKEVVQGYEFARKSGRPYTLPPLEKAVAYFEARAPERFTFSEPERAGTPPPVHFEPLGDGSGPQEFAVSNVNAVHLFDDRRTEILACDMRQNVVKLFRPYEPAPRWEVLAEAPHPAHAEVIDLDGDGIKDVVVACLGSFLPTDRTCGSVIWLRGGKDGKFTPVTLLEGVGRVADVRAADFRGTGALDLVVAVFGWREVGNIVLLENATTDRSRPKFVPHVLDDRHGAIHVPVADLNHDGRPDFVALISQEHETVVAFLNEGGGRFRKETVWAAPHPAYGSSGIELVDLDGDGDLDVLYTNGDSLDGNLIRPEHGVRWLENRGGFPFTPHMLTPLPGAHRAVAADFDGDGDLDVVAVSLLPSKVFPGQKGLDSVILLEQVSPGKFARHALERGACNHATCVAGDFYGDGRAHFATGSFVLFESAADSVTVWRNRGGGKKPTGR